MFLCTSESVYVKRDVFVYKWISLCKNRCFCVQVIHRVSLLWAAEEVCYICWKVVHHCVCF